MTGRDAANAQHSQLAQLLRRVKPTSYLFGVCLFVFLANLCASDFKGIWIDEGYRLAVANGGPFQGSLNERHPSDLSAVIEMAEPDVHQPLYYVQVNLLMRLSHSYSTVIQYITNTLVFLLSAAGVFYVARLFLPLEGQILCLLLYALNGQAMAFALQIREYCLILCLVVWNAYFFLRLLKASAEDTKPLSVLLLIGHLLSASLALYASFWAVFFLAPQGLLVLWQTLRGRKRDLLILASHFLAGLSLLPWLLYNTKKLDMKVWDPTHPTLAYLSSRLKTGFEFVLTGNVVHRWLPWAFQIMFVVFALAFIAFVVWSLLRFSSLDTARRYVLLACLFFFGFQITYSLLKDPLAASGRYFILYLPFTSLGLGIIFTEASTLFSNRAVRRSVFQTTCLIGVLGAGVLQILQYYHDPDVDHRDDFRQIYNYLESRVSPVDDVIVDAAVNARCLQFYSNRPSQFRVGFNEYKPIVKASSKDVWLVINRPELSFRSAFESLKNRLSQSGYRLVDKKRVEKTMILHYNTAGL